MGHPIHHANSHVNVRMFFHCFSLGNVERVKIGEAGKLAEASDVVVGQVQVRQGHQV